MRCHVCGRKVGGRIYTRRRFYDDGSDFVGHRSCYLEMRHPEDPKVGSARHDIKEGLLP